MPRTRSSADHIDVLKSLFHAEAHARVDELTTREGAVLAHIVKGATNREAAMAMGISVRTVEFHRANIMEKMDARNIADLMRILLGDHADDSVPPPGHKQN